MKKLIYLLIIFTVLSGCHSLSRTLSSSSQNKSNLDKSEGVGQGNGMIAYSNSLTGLNFEYPANWTLVESSDRKNVTLSNDSIENEISRIEFQYKTLLNNRHFNSIDDLKKYLFDQYPSKEWRDIILLNEQAIFWSDVQGKYEDAQYFSIDKNGLILEIKYHVVKNNNPEDVIKSIIKPMLIVDGNIHNLLEDIKKKFKFKRIYYSYDLSGTEELKERLNQLASVDSNYFDSLILEDGTKIGVVVISSAGNMADPVVFPGEPVNGVANHLQVVLTRDNSTTQQIEDLLTSILSTRLQEVNHRSFIYKLSIYLDLRGSFNLEGMGVSSSYKEQGRRGEKVLQYFYEIDRHLVSNFRYNNKRIIGIEFWYPPISKIDCWELDDEITSGIILRLPPDIQKDEILSFLMDHQL